MTNAQGSEYIILSRLANYSDGSVEIDLYREKTYTKKYLLDFSSHNPTQHKEAVVKALSNPPKSAKNQTSRKIPNFIL